ncbi:MAG: ribonuclease III [Verrucomicrobiaceae bacterium]|nr:ribonuclease III [Verrucomicrobiaceae bacterium]
MLKDNRTLAASYSRLEQRISYQFKNINLLRQALTHPSVSSDTSNCPRNNQRLEYLGDAALQLALSSLLFDRYPEADEGQLTKIRASIVSTKALARAATQLELGTYLTLGRGEDTSGGRSRPSNLADALEALLGAVYLDGGPKALHQVVHHLFEPSICTIQVGASEATTNPKGHLQELIQGQSATLPSYHIVEEAGPPHARHFRAIVSWGDVQLGTGEGSTKKLAETAAATAALASPLLEQLKREVQNNS